MDIGYDEFLALKARLKAQGRYRNHAENNLYACFPAELHIPARVTRGHQEDRVYRCHLVEDYLSFMSWPAEYQAFAGASQGVRHSLTVLFEHFRNDRWLLPQDVYPFYLREAAGRGLACTTYPTLNEPLHFAGVDPSIRIMLSIYPLKPKGVYWTEAEQQACEQWLGGGPDRILILDLVYHTQRTLPAGLKRLYQTNQVILLHSLSKMFLLPSHFGVCLLPHTALGRELRERFKALPKDETRLKAAFNALHDFQWVHDRVRQQLWNWHVERIAPAFPWGNDPRQPLYLFYSPHSFEYWLNERGVLAIPESVFGGKANGSVLSSLPDGRPAGSP